MSHLVLGLGGSLSLSLSLSLCPPFILQHFAWMPMPMAMSFENIGKIVQPLLNRTYNHKG